jgi:ABC-type branched-subunit amino acid transport system ATPase component
MSRVVTALSLDASLGRRPEELPFSARRAVAVARSIASNPLVVLLDEPAAGLSELEREKLSETIKWVATELRVAVLLVEHDVSLVSKVSDRVLALDQGRVVAIGEPDQVLGDRRVIESYIGAETDFDVEHVH